MPGGDRAAIPWKTTALAGMLLILGIALWNRHSRNARAEAPIPAPASTTASPAAQSPASPSAVNPAALTPVPVPATATDAAEENDVTTKNLQPLRAANKTPEPAPALILVIRAAESSWVSVTADGQPITQETLIAPAHTSIRAHREIVVKAGNAAGISFLLNGKEIPPQGAEGEVKTLLFDSTGLRTSATAQTPDPAH
jgi:hypothetical protein